MKDLKENYEKFRWFFTLSGKLVIGGKSASSNEELLKEIMKSKNDFVIMHTSSPGSPFSVIISDVKKITKEDLKETAIFTGCFSQDWKRGKKTSKIDIFHSSQLKKAKLMKTGTFGVSGKIKRIEIELRLYLKEQKGKIRAVPFKSGDIVLIPGKITKEKKAKEISKSLNIQEQEIIQALPSGSFK